MTLTPPVLTIDSPDRVLFCDWDPTRWTLFVPLEPDVQTGGAEDVVVRTDDRLLHLMRITD